MRNCRAPDDVIFHVVVDHTVFFRREVGHQMAVVGRIKRRGLRRPPAGEIRVADDGHAILGHDLFVHDGLLTVAAFFCRQINDYRPRLHRRNHVGGPDFGRFAVEIGRAHV